MHSQRNHLVQNDNKDEYVVQFCYYAHFMPKNSVTFFSVRRWSFNGERNRRNWRWSESPVKEIIAKNTESSRGKVSETHYKSSKRSRSQKRDRSRSRSNRSCRSRSRSRSRHHHHKRKSNQSSSPSHKKRSKKSKTRSPNHPRKKKRRRSRSNDSRSK